MWFYSPFFRRKKFGDRETIWTEWISDRAKSFFRGKNGFSRTEIHSSQTVSRLLNFFQQKQGDLFIEC